ncbi:MAG: gliding motility-associated C-terminal domain-containing protein [Crocinitomicaceae bacterium]|nr:gliding motility-associated C-terminal domain-containing protein [Crocinitomicaceae bacterium]
MKKFLLLLAFIGISIFSKAQCPFDNTFLMDATPPACPGTFTVGCMNGGEYVSINTIAGNTYTFTTCGGTLDDTELTLYNSTGTLIYDSNDDDCGVQSTINWVAPATETVNLLLDEFPCSNSGSCIDVQITCTPPVQSGNGCNTDITICTPGVAGPFGFNTPGPPVSTCLDFFGPTYAYIVLYITQSGPLEMLINGDANSGYLDVAVFDIPPSQDPCVAIQSTTNEIGCNYADFDDGCNQFGTSFPCTSSVPSPNVVAGDVLMIVVENWSGTSNTFTMELAPPPAAQTGPPDPTINPVGPFCDTDPPVQVTAVNMGGTWTGTGISSSGIFDPGTAGVGSFAIDYSIGQPPCQAASQTTIDVISCTSCLITNMTASIGACSAGAYQTTGVVEFTSAPATGQLIIEDCNGNQQVVNAPFTSPVNYTISGQTPDGLACDITAYFTDDVLCTQNIGYTAPTCPCNMDNFTVNIGACDPNTDNYMLNGTAEFTNPPATGTLIIEVDNGTTTYDTIINLPFVSPQTWSISGIPSDGSNCTVTVFFSDNAGCSNSLNYTAPSSCLCEAIAGTYNDNITGSTTTPYELCFGDQLDINANGDYTPAQDFNIGGVTYDPGIWLAVYSCNPSVMPPGDINTDPCFLGIASTNNGVWSIINNTGSGNTFFYVPITMYSMVDGIYAIAINGGDWCYDMGPVYEVTYLPEITASFVEDCLAGTATVTVNGGLPELDGSDFTASNLSPASASFGNTTTPDGGTIVVNGLQGGDNWSFDITDNDGCPITVTGGPFPPLEDPGFNYPQSSYCTSEAASTPTITGTTGGFFASTPAGLTINPVSGQITPATSTPGTYDITYTTPGTCFDDSTVTINIALTPSVNPVADQTVCDGSAFTAINFTGSAGSTFNWTNDNTNIGLGASGTGNIATFTGTAPTVQEVSSILVTPTAGACTGVPTLFNLTVNPLDDPSFNYAQTSWCTSEAPMTPTITGLAGGTFSATPAGLTLNTTTGQITPATTTPGTYDVTYTTAGACPQSSTVTVNIAATPSVNPVTDQTVCDGSAFTAITFTGSAGSTFNWTNDNTNTGLAASGTGNIAAFNGTAPTVQEVSNVTVTPSAGTCVGTPTSFTLTVNPLDDPSFNYAQTSWCTVEAPMTPTITGTTGGTFSATPAGLSLNTTTGEITPATSTPGTYDVTYTTAGACPQSSTITVNVAATPTVNPVTDQTVCDGASFTAINFTGSAGTTFNWTNDNMNTGLAGSGTGNIAAFNGTAPTVQEVSNITVTPTAGSCVGTPTSFALTVNPTEDASFSYPAAAWCTSDVLQNATITGTAGGTFSSSPAGLSINTANGDITPGSSTPGTYDVTYTTPGICSASSTVTITINEVPVADPVLDQTVCVGSNFSPINYTSTTAGTTFDWTNSNTLIGLSANGTGNIAAFAAQTTGGTISGTVTVTPSTSSCTGNDISFTLTVNDMDDPSFDYTPGLTYCQTAANPVENITGLTGGSFSYIVSSGGPTLDINTSTGAINLITSSIGAYDITYNTAGALGSLCPNTMTLQLVITGAPVADFTLGDYCANANDPLPTYINGGSGGIFSSTAGLVINPNTGQVDLSASTPGTYTVTNDINVAGCPTATATDDITIFELPSGTIAGTTTICAGDPLPDITLNATAGTGDWTFNYTLNGTPQSASTSGTSTTTINGASIGTYNLVSITDANGCTQTLAGQVVIGQYPLPVMDNIAAINLCDGSLAIVPDFTSTPQAVTFDWTNTGTDVGFGMSGQGNIGTFIGINTGSTAITGTIQVTPTSADGCVGNPMSFNIIVHPRPTVSFMADTLYGCEPLIVNFTNTSNIPGQNCFWTMGDGSTINGCGPIVYSYPAGVYDVSLTVTTAQGCTSSFSAANYISVDIVPEALFTYSPQELTIENTIVDFTNHSNNATTYEWDFGDDSPISTQESLPHLYPETPGSYMVTLTAYNGICMDQISQQIIIKDEIIFYVPNVFTPDGDMFNEMFQPVFTSGFDPFDFHLTIFNRWGEVIFESFNADKGWNGHYGHQGLVEDGVYVWQIEFKESMTDKHHTHRGHVTVLK